MTNSIIRRGLDQLGGLLGQIGPDDLDRPTPCAEWTVTELSDHVVNSVAGMVAMARGAEPDWAANPHHDDPAAALQGEGHSLLEAIDGAGGAFPEGMAAAELAVHAYDLAAALGQPTSALDPEVADAGYAFMSTSLTDDRRGAAFGPQQPAPDGADAYQRIAAFAGRTV